MVGCAPYNCVNGSTSGWSMHSFPKKRKLCWKHYEEQIFVSSPTLAWSVGYGMKSVMLTEDAIPTIFSNQRDAKPKRIINLMEKLNRKRVCIRDNRIILGVNYWTFTSSHISEQVKFNLFAQI